MTAAVAARSNLREAGPMKHGSSIPASTEDPDGLQIWSRRVTKAHRTEPRRVPKAFQRCGIFSMLVSVAVQSRYWLQILGWFQFKVVSG
jgi:hypothetical protein